MQPQSDSDYKKIFTELIKKQIIVLGPDITLAKVKNVQGIEMSEQGEVISIQGDAQRTLQLLINEFVELSGLIVKKTMESILATYPGIAVIETSAISGSVFPPVSASSIQDPQVKTQNPEPAVMGANPFSDVAVATPEVISSANSPQSNTGAGQFPKEEMDSINKALSELNNNPIVSQPQTPLENKTDNMQQSNSN